MLTCLYVYIYYVICLYVIRLHRCRQDLGAAGRRGLPRRLLDRHHGLLQHAISMVMNMISIVSTMYKYYLYYL